MSRKTSDRLVKRASLRSALLRIVGMPDYEAHVAHLREVHPDRPVPTEREYFDEYVQHRYAKPPVRCC